MNARRWLVSMTTLPSRIQERKTIERVLDRLFRQRSSVLTISIVIHVPSVCLRNGEPYEYGALEELRKRFSDESLIIHRLHHDFGSATKFIGLTLMDPAFVQGFEAIFICDDDILFHRNMFSRLRRMISRESFQKKTVWANVASPSNVPEHTYDHVQQFAGLLVLPSFVTDLYVFFSRNLHMIPRAVDHPCFNVDDSLISFILLQLGYRVQKSGLNLFFHVWDYLPSQRHPKWFELHKHTDRNMCTTNCIQWMIQQ